jgi:eukaryotic-like serine/threonine-protein kinase
MAETNATGAGNSPDPLDRRVDVACDAFEAAWRAGQAPRIEDYLAGAEGADRRALLGELLGLELEMRRKRGDRPGRREYLDRFPADPGLVETAFGSTPGPEPRAASDLNRDAACNLLLGLLALQNNFVGREALLGAFAAWVADKARPLGRILRDQGTLDDARHALLEALVAEHLKLHGGDPQRSLVALSSIASARRDLEGINDPDIQVSLASVSSRATVGDGHSDVTMTLTAPSSSSQRVGGRFRILRFHREGGLGRVYVARDEELGREVALKEVRPDKAAETSLLSRFVLEAEINGGLEHPGIVPVYSLGTYDDGRPFYAMRFVDGDSLKEAIESYHKKHPQPDPSAVEFRKLLGRFVDVCEAIAFAHSKGVLHRDLKPHNVMLGRFGETLLIDWGLAKATGRREPTGPESAPEATLVPPSGSGHAQTVGVLGSPPYMSPEQAAGAVDSLGPATDVYGLGAILFALLTGGPPVEGKTTDEILYQVQQGAIRPLRSLNSNIPPALEAVCLKALALKPEDRYATALTLAEEVEHWLADEPVTAWREPFAMRARRWARRNRTAMTAAAATLVAGVIGLSAVAVVQAQANNNLKEALAEITKAKMETESCAMSAQEALAQKGAALMQSEESRQRAEAVLTFLRDDVFAATRPEGRGGGLGKDVTVREAVNAAEPKIAEAFKDQPIIEAEVRDTLGETYWYLGDPPLAIRQFERAVTLRQTRLGPDHTTTLQSRNNLATAYESLGRWAAAEAQRRDTLDRRRKAEKPDSPLIGGDLAGLGSNLLNQAKWSEAELVLRECLEIREKAVPDDWLQFSTMSQLGGALLGQGRYAEAEPLVVLGYEGMKAREAKIPAAAKACLPEAALRVVRLYEGWGQTGQAKAWKEKLGLADLPANLFVWP